MGTVELLVRDFDTMLTYSRDFIALGRIATDRSTHVLGRHGVPTLTLTHSPTLPAFDRGGAGLFHTAVVFETRAALAVAVARVAQSGIGRFTVSARHLVSEAFSFDDPKGNGVELCFDGPSASWSRDPDGKPLMGTLGFGEVFDMGTALFVAAGCYHHHVSLNVWN